MLVLQNLEAAMNTGQDKLKEIIQKENEQRQQDMMVGRFDNFSLLLQLDIALITLQ